ncbi:hypothetical protein U27_02926 [Candidatus Vecturithrix granuli]|uniref:Uncharacterized protein n=1 Tax=Vecturithrix granuli TaxID=1499967 RepID=A0A081BUG0_VECG1|nr:hypothetical protein U27_02926 [Candidatus Vecturithrix granuli]
MNSRNNFQKLAKDLFDLFGKERIEDIFRDELIEELIRSNGEVDIMLMRNLSKEIAKMNIYLKTLEEFIEEQKQNEIKRVDQEAKKLPEAQRARLYAWDNFTPWEGNIYR